MHLQIAAVVWSSDLLPASFADHQLFFCPFEIQCMVKLSISYKEGETLLHSESFAVISRAKTRLRNKT
jgi:hypothetical protein